MTSYDRKTRDLLQQLVDGVHPDDVPVVVSSGNVASAAAIATIAAVAEQHALLAGFRVSGLGATAAGVVVVTVEGVSDDPLEFALVVAEGATVPNEDLDVIFPFPVPASDPDVDIVVTCPDLGDGNTHNQVTAYALYRPASELEPSDTPVVVASGNVANAIATATIPAIAGKIAHLTEIRIEGLGATAGSTKTATVVGVAGDDLDYPVVVETGAAVPNADVRKRYPFGLPAEDDETDIVVSCPALGAGNTHNLVTAFGFYRDA